MTGSIVSTGLGARLRVWTAAYLVCIVTSALIQASADADEVSRRLRTQISDIPWSPPSRDERIIYGVDDRIDVFQETDPTRLMQAASTCALISNSDLTNNGDGTFTILLSAYTYAGLPPCPGEAFASQPTAAFCSGFMVGPDLIATAGHCVGGTLDLQNFSFVFGFDMIDAIQPVSIVNGNHVYSGSELLSWTPGGDFDHALVRVSQPITSPGAIALPVRESGVIATGIPVGVIGHPHGLPKKIAFGASTQVTVNVSPTYFLANLDTYGGNSGSPVFNQNTGLVEGILVRGLADFTLGASCFSSNVLPNNFGAEEVTRVSVIPSYLLREVDTDQDLIDDAFETDTGTFVSATDTGTDPNDPDSDDDGVIDGTEVQMNTDPNNALSFPSLPVSAAWLLTTIAGVAVASAGMVIWRRKRDA